MKLLRQKERRYDWWPIECEVGTIYGEEGIHTHVIYLVSFELGYILHTLRGHVYTVVFTGGIVRYGKARPGTPLTRHCYQQHQKNMSDPYPIRDNGTTYTHTYFPLFMSPILKATIAGA